MSSDAVAGAILIELKAQASELNRTFEQAQSRVESFGQGVVKTADQVGAASERMKSTLTAMADVSSKIQGGKTFFVEGSQSLPASLNAIAQASKRAAAGSMEMDNAFSRTLITMKELSRNVNAGSKSLTENFRTIDEGMDEAFSKNEAKNSAHIAQLIGRLISVQFAMQQLGSHGAGDASKFGRGVEVLEKSISTFALTLSVMPNKAGLVVGALAAVGTAFVALTGPTEEQIKLFEKFQQRAEDTAKTLEGLETSASSREVAFALNKGFPLKTQTQEELQQNNTLQERERLISKIVELRKEENDLFKERRKLADIRAGINSDPSDPLVALFSQNPGEINDKLAANAKRGLALPAEIEAATKALKESTEAARAFAETLEQAGKRETLIKGVKESLEQTAISLAANQDALQKGLVDPIEAAKRETDLLLQRAEAVRQFKASLASLPAGVTKNVNLTLPNADPAAIAAKARQEQEQADRDQADRDIREMEEINRRTADLASGLSMSIGSAVSDGILHGASAMEILANTGQNLFKNMLDKSVDNFEAGMIKAFQSIGGQGGEILGTTLTGVLGVVGGIFAKKAGKGTDSFAGVQSRIESSQAVRGILAGPASVAVAALDEKLGQAFEPSRQILQQMLTSLRSIDRKSGAGGAGFASSMATT